MPRTRPRRRNYSHRRTLTPPQAIRQQAWMVGELAKGIRKASKRRGKEGAIDLRVMATHLKGFVAALRRSIDEHVGLDARVGPRRR